ncbi:MAG: hypothetical protein QMB98_06460 [Flaviflexus sp.]|uniref:hypothetical protein n=1 Tax=Flaviflexus sp. TaxID=1969482 RepID=UPI00352D2709
MNRNPNQRIILWSTGLVVFGLILSVIGLVLYEFTPAGSRNWSAAIPSVATLGLTLGGVIIITRAQDPELGDFASNMWKTISYATAAIIAVVLVIAAITLDPVTALILGLVAVQGPIAAWFVSDQLGKST